MKIRALNTRALTTRALTTEMLDGELVRRLGLLCAVALFLVVYYTTPLSRQVAMKLTAWNYATTIAVGMEAFRTTGRLSQEQG